jgi:Na+/proline symporter
VRDDISYPIVLTSFLIIILGIFVSFYLYPRFIMYEDGKLITTSRRNGWVFYQSVKSAVAKKERNNVSID